MNHRTNIAQVRQYSLWITIAACLLLAGCWSSVSEPLDVVGQWQAKYHIDNFGTRIGGTEFITLTESGKFKQRYEDGNGYAYESDWGDWKFVQVAPGKYQVHLEYARFYPMGIQFAEDLASGKAAFSLYDPATRRTVPIREKIILNIEPSPSSPHGIALFHLPVGDLDSPQYVKFELLREGGPQEPKKAKSKLDYQKLFHRQLFGSRMGIPCRWGWIPPSRGKRVMIRRD